MTRVAARSMVAGAVRQSAGELSMATQIRWTGLVTPEQEYQFLPTRRYRFDFAWPVQMVALEVEGGTFTAGRHSRGVGFEADCLKYAEAAIAGWLVLRVTTGMVEDGRAIALLERALTAVPRNAA